VTGLDLLSHVDEPARWIAGVVAGLVALGWLGRRVLAFFRRLNAVLDLVDHELNYNSGKSLKDQSRQTGHRFDAQDKKIDRIAEAVGVDVSDIQVAPLDKS